MTIQEINEILTKVQFHPGHMPVLIKEVLECFSNNKPNLEPRYFDGTFGRGGHYRALKEMLPQMRAVVMDQDQQAIEYAQLEFQTEVQKNELKIIAANFAEFLDQNLGQFDMMLLDLGVSSPQLDQGERGFSFYHDGPLDMRMDQSRGVTAEYLVNTCSEDELIRIFQEFGEIRKPYRVVRAICHDRKSKAFQSTKELAGLIERVDGWRSKGHHPATLYFMGLRLAVNNELGILQETLPQMMGALKPGGRLAVISFHSLEDRIVKNIFKGSDLGRQIHKKVIIATQEECDQNPRSRSAKLRVFEREIQDESSGYQAY